MKNIAFHLIVKFLSISLLILFFASCSRNELVFYSCPSKEDAKTCNKKCEVDKSVKYSFLINKEDKSVFQIVYWDGEQRGTHTHKNCKIFNDLNWDCSESTDMGHSVWYTYAIMANGIFTTYDKRISNSGFRLLNPNEGGVCAK